MSMQITFTGLKEISKKTVPAGHRLARVINKGSGAVSYGAIVPALAPETINTLLEQDVVKNAVAEMLASVQDKLIRAAVMDSGNKDKIVDSEQFSSEMIVAFLTAQEESNKESFRLSGDKIAAWFKEELSALLAVAIKAKTTNISDKLLGETLESFSKHFQSLAKKEVSMKESVKKQLEKALALLPDDHDSVITEAISKKLADASEATVELDAL